MKVLILLFQKKRKCIFGKNSSNTYQFGIINKTAHSVKQVGSYFFIRKIYF